MPTHSFQQSRKDNPLDCSSALLACSPFAFDNDTQNTHTFCSSSSKGRRRSNKKREKGEQQAEKQWKARNAGNGPLVSWRVFNATDSRRSDGNPTEWVHIDPGYHSRPPSPFLHPLVPSETAPRPVANDGCTFTIVFTLLERGQGGVMINFPCTN